MPRGVHVTLEQISKAVNEVATETGLTKSGDIKSAGTFIMDVNFPSPDSIHCTNKFIAPKGILFLKESLFYGKYEAINVFRQRS